MSETNDEQPGRPTPATDEDLEAQRAEVAEVDEELDARSDGDGLAAEAGRGEETGLAEG